jgi:uncharacterized protein
MNHQPTVDPPHGKWPLPAAGDLESKQVPPALPKGIIDAHVHLFPEALFSSIWAWLDSYAWPVRYRLGSNEIITFLHGRGIDRLAGLLYAHKPGMARGLNQFMAELCQTHPRVIGLGTVFPGEPEAELILREAFALGLRGVKLHVHVQYFDLDSEAMHPVYRACADHHRPLVMHVGREPKNPDYPYRIDPYLLCQVDKMERILKAYPTLKICVPHLGFDENPSYLRLIERYNSLWLDTAMVLADYLPGTSSLSLAQARPDRLIYGSDFPNIPYAWDRELQRVADRNLSPSFLERFLRQNAEEFFALA